MKVLFLVLHRKNRSPGQRYRHEQYLDYLTENGVDYTLDPLLKTAKEDAFFYGKKIVPKFFIGIKALVRRFLSLSSVYNYDVVYIYRDAFFFGTFFEKIISRKKVKIIYDFDDAIWLMDENPNQGIFNKLKNPKKTERICRLADRVIVGNQYLANYASQFCNDVQIIPSTIDFNKYTAFIRDDKERVCIGWTGSFSTLKHFETIQDALGIIKIKYQDRIYFKVIGDQSYYNEALNIQGVKWVASTEAHDLSELSIGVMPLPENDWTKGKCGMKGLQYMALEIPTIMSPVGVNSDIIQDGENGFLAATTDEWVEKLSMLIEDQSLRKRLGKAGRKTVEEKYSVKVNKDKWLKAFQF